MRRISSEPLLILYCYLLPFHLQLFNGYMTPCTYAIIWIKNRGYRIETQSRLPTLRFHSFIYTCSPATRNLCVCRIGFADTQRLHNGVTKVTPLHLIKASVAGTW